MPNATTPVLVQGDREFYPEDIDHIRIVLQRFPGLPRKEVALTLCETLNWLTPAGRPKLDACFKLLQRLEQEAVIRLPAKREQYSHPGARRQPQLTLPTERPTPVAMSLAELGPVELIPLIDLKQRSLCNGYLQRYHPLGYKQPFGYRQRYFIEAGIHRLGCIVLSGPAKALTARDRWIGWNDRQRLANLPWVINNSRYLIFPWVEVANLASHVLGQLARRVGDDWERRWGYRPLLLETFVDPAHFHGGCYRAAGWELLGRTTGEGLVRPGKQYRTTPKLIFAKPLQADFRRLLSSNQLQGRTEL